MNKKFYKKSKKKYTIESPPAYIKDKLDLGQLRTRCEMSINSLLSVGDVRGKVGEQHSFIDNSSNILAVAHCDTVQQCNHFQVCKLTGETLIFNPKLDDRLGVYTILDLLPSLGITTDILLTENEEVGASTASYFIPKKQYNWIFEFDRAGTGVVTYCYDWGKELTDTFEVHQGSFSDISYLEHLGCKGLNVACGYYNEHDKRAYFVVEEYILQIWRFMKFYHKHKHTSFEHTDKVKYLKPLNRYAMDNYPYDWYCDDCNKMLLEAELVYDETYNALCPDCSSVIEMF